MRKFMYVVNLSGEVSGRFRGYKQLNNWDRSGISQVQPEFAVQAPLFGCK